MEETLALETMKSCKYKKVLRCDRKRCTAHGSSLGWEEVTLRSGQGVILLRGTTVLTRGYPSPLGRTWNRTFDSTSNRTRGTPRKDLGPEAGKGLGSKDQGTLLPEQIHTFKTITSRRTSYMGGNNAQWSEDVPSPGHFFHLAITFTLVVK